MTNAERLLAKLAAQGIVPTGVTLTMIERMGARMDDIEVGLLLRVAEAPTPEHSRENCPACIASDTEPESDGGAE